MKGSILVYCVIDFFDHDHDHGHGEKKFLNHDHELLFQPGSRSRRSRSRRSRILDNIQRQKIFMIQI
jgi:hypothetical protein